MNILTNRKIPLPKQTLMGVLTTAGKAIEDCEAKLQAASQPAPITFEISPSK